MDASNTLDAIMRLFRQEANAQGQTEMDLYHQDETRWLEENGLADCSPEEISEAFSLMYEKGPVNQGATVLGTQVAGGPTTVSVAPPPPPPPAQTLPPVEQVKQTVNYYVSNTSSNYSETHVDDRDTNVDSSVNTNVFAEDSTIDLDIDNETTTASGDGAVAAGDDAEGVATGDGAVAAGEDISGGVNTGSNSGVITGENGDVDDTIVGDGNTQVNDSENVSTGSGDVTDVDIENSDLENVNFGDGNSIEDSSIDIDAGGGEGGGAPVILNNVGTGEGDVTQDNSVDVTDSFNTDNSITLEDSFDIEDSFKIEDSFDAEESFNTEVEAEEAPMEP